MGAFYLAVATEEALGTPYALPLVIISLVGGLFVFVYLGWATVGTWRSATYRGGFWAGAAKAALVLSWLSGINQTIQAFQMPHPTPLVPTDKSHLDIDPNAVQSWSQVGQWVIRYDDSDGVDGTPNGCFMYRKFGDAGLRIGFYGRANWYSVMFRSDTLNTRIEVDKYYTINLKFGDETPWTVKALAKIFVGTNIKVLMFLINDQQFFTELVSNNSLIISQNGSPISELSVTGAQEALTAMQKCQESHRQNTPTAP
jgi:hypothetical protein